MTADCATWRRDRLAELDLIDAQIENLPPLICNEMLRATITLATLINGNPRVPLRMRIEANITQLAAELARITVAPAPGDGEVK